MVSLLSIQTGGSPLLVEAEYGYSCSRYSCRCWVCSPLLGCLVPLHFCSSSTLGCGRGALSSFVSLPAPAPSALVSPQQTGPVFAGKQKFGFGIWILDFEQRKGAQSHVSPVMLPFHLISVLSSTQDLDASVWSHSCFSFIRIFPVVLGCFPSSFLLIASNCVSAETAAVSPTCNLSHLPT